MDNFVNIVDFGKCNLGLNIKFAFKGIFSSSHAITQRVKRISPNYTACLTQIIRII